MFVYRGKEYEKIGEFVVRIQSQYPSAQVWQQTVYICPTQIDDSVGFWTYFLYFLCPLTSVATSKMQNYTDITPK